MPSAPFLGLLHGVCGEGKDTLQRVLHVRDKGLRWDALCAG